LFVVHRILGVLVIILQKLAGFKKLYFYISDISHVGKYFILVTDVVSLFPIFFVSWHILWYLHVHVTVLPFCSEYVCTLESMSDETDGDFGNIK